MPPSPTEGVDFALARVNGMRGDQVLHIAPPDGAKPASKSLFVASAARGARHLLSARAGACRTQCAAAHRRAPRERRRRRLRSSTPRSTSALRADASIDHCRLQNVRGCRELLRHADRARGRTRELPPAHHHARRAHVALHDAASSSPAARRAASSPRRSIANRLQTHDMFAEIEHAARRHGDARALSRHRHRSRQARLQRQDDRARIRARRGLRPVAEDRCSPAKAPKPRCGRSSRSTPTRCAPNTARPPASSTSRCCSTCCRAASTGAPRRRCCSGPSSKTPSRAWTALRCAPKSSNWSRRSSTKCPRSKDLLGP